MGDDFAKRRGKYRYSKVSRRIRRDEKFRRLSKPNPNGQSLFLWLLTCAQQCVIPGLIAMGEAAMAEELEWPLEGFRKAFREVLREGLVKADWNARLVWVPKSIWHNEPANPNVIIGWSNDWDELPECDLKSQAYTALRSYTEQRGESWAKAFRKGCPKPSRKGCRKQDQDQDQDQEQDQDHKIGASGGVADGPAGADVVELPKRSEEDLAVSRVWNRFQLLRSGRYPASRGLAISKARTSMIRARLRDYDEARVMQALEKFFDPNFFWANADHAKRPELLFRSVDQFEKIEAAKPLAPKTGVEMLRERRANRERDVIDADAEVTRPRGENPIKKLYAEVINGS